MAVYAAHLTRTLQGTPSVFQVTAQEALGSTVKPALRKLIEVNFKGKETKESRGSYGRQSDSS